MSKLIDVHHHILDEDYVNAWKASGTIPPGLTPPAWTPQLDLEFMDRHGIDAAILSLSAPGLAFVADWNQAALARKINETCAAVRDQKPSRFGFFATLPVDNLVNVNGPGGGGNGGSVEGVEEGVMAELAHAFDNLRADGVTLLTSYSGGQGQPPVYLGDARFRGLWAELDRREAVVFVHPTSPQAAPPPSSQGNPPSISGGSTSGSGVGRGGGPGVPPPIIDFPHETTRCAVNLIISNVVRDFPRVKIILSHGGGTLPFVARRVADLMADSGLLGKLGKTVERFLDEARSFYFDLALTGYEESMALVLSFAKEGQVLYGSDFPFARDRAVAGQLSTVKGWRDEKVRESVERGAAERLFPRLVQQ